MNNEKDLFPQDAADDHDFLRKLDERLHAKGREAFTDVRTKLSKNTNSSISSWQKSNRAAFTGFDYKGKVEPIKKGISYLSLGILVISIILFLGSITYAFFSLTKGGFTVKQENIDLQANFPALSNSGSMINSEIILINKNRVEFQEANISIDIVNNENESRQNLSRIDIGKANSGEKISKNINFTLNGTEGEIKNIEVTLFYKLMNSNTVFQKKINKEIKIIKSPIIINLSGPKSISIGQVSDYRVSLRGGSGLLPSIAIKLELPKDFKIINSSVAPDAKDYFKIGEIKEGQEKVFTFSAEYKNATELLDNFNIVVKVGTSGEDDIQDILSKESLSLALSRIPFLLSISSENQEGAIQYFTGKTPKIKLNIENTSKGVVKNGVLNLKFGGGLFNAKSVSVSGAQYDAGTLSAKANKETNVKLTELLPGEKVEFEIAYLDLNQTNVSTNRRLLLDASFSVDIPDNINSPIVSRKSLSLLPKDNTNVAIKSLYFSGAFKNIGPVPPRIGQKTSYTISASIDTLGGFDKGVMTIKLPSDIEYIESSNSSTKYDKNKREIIWNVGNMKKSSGEILSSNKIENSIRVSIIPSPDQFRLSPNLTNGVRFEATGIDKNIISLDVPDISINFFQDPKYEYSKGYSAVAE